MNCGRAKQMSVSTTFCCLYVYDVSEVAQFCISLFANNTKLRSALLTTGLLIRTEFFVDQSA